MRVRRRHSAGLRHHRHLQLGGVDTQGTHVLTDCGTHAAACARYRPTPTSPWARAVRRVAWSATTPKVAARARAEAARSGSSTVRSRRAGSAKTRGSPAPRTVRPSGSACAMENMTCDYGSCSVEGRARPSAARTASGKQAFVGCPLWKRSGTVLLARAAASGVVGGGRPRDRRGRRGPRRRGDRPVAARRKRLQPQHLFSWGQGQAEYGPFLAEGAARSARLRRR